MMFSLFQPYLDQNKNEISAFRDAIILSIFSLNLQETYLNRTLISFDIKHLSSFNYCFISK